MLATQELNKQNSGPSQRLAVNARKLAEFLQSVEAKEALLVQRARDREVRDAIADANVRYEDSSGSTSTRDGAVEMVPRDGSLRPSQIPELREEYGEF